MSKRIFARIAGTGGYLPEKVLTNNDLAHIVDTSDEWIRTRTGIRERHIAAEGETTSDLAYEAAIRALEAAEVRSADLDLIVVGTTTPDLIFPSTACLLQARLGAVGCGAFDVNAACSGFVYALSVAEKFVSSGCSKTVLVVGADTLTRIIDWSDRTTCVLFGDGARRWCSRLMKIQGFSVPICMLMGAKKNCCGILLVCQLVLVKVKIAARC